MISIVIPVRDGAAHLPRCLTSIAANGWTADAFEIVVVDNGSSDGSGAIARRYGARVVDRPGVRVGACRNAGAAASSGDILAFVDADHEIGAGWLKSCAGAFQELRTGAVGYPYHSPANPTWVQQLYDALRVKSGDRRDVEWLGAGNLAIRRDVFEQVGGFDEHLEACEDVHLCHKVRQAGYRIVSEPGMLNVHHGDPKALSDLFLGELWRGRNNLRVSLQGPLTLRALPSVLVPVVALSSLVLLVLGLVAWPWVGSIPASVGGAALAVVVFSRTLVIVRRAQLASPVAWGRACVVAATYETARALSLVSTATHRTRSRVRRHA